MAQPLTRESLRAIVAHPLHTRQSRKLGDSHRAAGAKSSSGNAPAHPASLQVSMLASLALFGGWGVLLGPLLFRLAVEGLEISCERAVV
jgi:hypothetical protein